MAQSVADKAAELRNEAVYHKRQSRRHKMLAREKMAELARFCAQHGILFTEAESESNQSD